MILDSGADVNAHDINGRTPLHKAVENGDLNTVEILLNHKANYNLFSNKGYFPMHIAAQKNFGHIIKFLYEKGANVNCVDNQKCTPLIHAAKHNNMDAMGTLLSCDAKIYCGDIRKWNALHYAAYGSMNDAVRLLVTWDADKDKLKTAKNSQGRTPYLIISKNYTKEVFHTLWSSAKEGDIAMFRRLIIKGADINCQTQGYGRTPLIYAAKHQQFLIVKFIMDKNGDANKLDSFGKSAMDYARETNNTSIMEVLASDSGSNVMKSIKEVPEDDEADGNFAGDVSH